MDATDALVRRSGDLKRELLDFARKPRFERALRQEIRKRFGRSGPEDDLELFNLYDWFIQEYRLHDGRTIIDCFLEARRDLPEAEREFLLGWRRVRHGLFESKGVDGVVLVADNLIDDLTYRIWTNMEPGPFERVPTGSFLSVRVVPVNDEWLATGFPRLYPEAAREDILRSAAQISMEYPGLVFHNPDKVAAGWKQQRDQYAAFVRHFGADEITVPVAEIPGAMAGFWLAFTDGASSGHDSDISWVHDSVETVGVIYDEIQGLGSTPTTPSPRRRSPTRTSCGSDATRKRSRRTSTTTRSTPCLYSGWPLATPTRLIE